MHWCIVNVLFYLPTEHVVYFVGTRPIQYVKDSTVQENYSYSIKPQIL